MAKKTKQLIGEISVCAAALAILLTILIPTISVCVENGSETRCRERLQVLSDALNKAVADAAKENGGEGFFDGKNSRRLIEELISAVPPEDAEDLTPDEYYIISRDNRLYIKSAEHSDIDDYYANLPQGFPAPELPKDESGFVDGLRITGVRTYMQNESIDPAAPEKMSFTGSDDLKKLFPDLSVRATYIGGGETELSPESYTLFTDGFDMSVPGTKTIRVSYDSGKRWRGTIYADFTFEVMERAQCPPLEINFGDNGVYTLAAWDWSDFVAEASQTEGGAKDFDASIVYYDGKYYYYPDGFNIDSRRGNSDPETSAADIDKPTRAAYRIEFKTDTIIASKEDENEMKKAEAGALMLEDGQVYIWQTEPSKEVGAGWIRVYCEMKKNEPEG